MSYEGEISWLQCLEDERIEQGDAVGPITLSNSVWDRISTSPAGFDYRNPPLAWTRTRVYWAVIEDRGQWVESIPRNPPVEFSELAQ